MFLLTQRSDGLGNKNCNAQLLHKVNKRCSHIKFIQYVAVAEIPTSMGLCNASNGYIAQSDMSRSCLQFLVGGQQEVSENSQNQEIKMEFDISINPYELVLISFLSLVQSKEAFYRFLSLSCFCLYGP